MIKLVHGDDEFSSKETLNKLIGNKNDPEIDLNLLYSNSVTENNFRELINTMSLFGSSRKLVFYDLLSKILSSKKDDWKDFIDLCINKPSVNEVIFFETKEINLNSSKIKKISEFAEITLSNLPSGRGSWEKIRSWIISRQKKYQLELSIEAINKLIDLVGNNYRYLDNELFKLSNFKPNQKIEEEDIEIMVSGIKESSIFELIDAILQKDILKSTNLLNELVGNGQNFFSIQQMLTRQIRLIIMTQDLTGKLNNSEIQNKIQVKSNFAFNKIKSQSNQFAPSKMKSMLRTLLDLDLGIKSGNKSEKEVLNQLVHIL